MCKNNKRSAGGVHESQKKAKQKKINVPNGVAVCHKRKTKVCKISKISLPNNMVFCPAQKTKVREAK